MSIVRGFIVVMLVAVPAASAVAQPEPMWDLELEAGQFLADGETDSGARDAFFGVGARRWLGDRWALGLGLRSLDVDEGPGESLDVYFVDLSAAVRVFEGDRVDLVAVGGPGLFRSEFEEGPQSETRNELTLRAGLGARVALGDRAFLRPEAAVRWIDGFGDELHAELGLALGIRLGS